MRAMLTNVSVRALKVPARGQYTIWDTNSPVGVRVSDGGAKSFTALVGSGKRRMIGKVGIITLAEARAEAKRILAGKTLGISKPKASSVTFSSATALFLEENYRVKRPRTKKEKKRLIERHFVLKFAKKLISEIADSEVGEILAKLARVPSEQLHAFRAVRTMLKWCTRPPRRYITRTKKVPPATLASASSKPTLTVVYSVGADQTHFRTKICLKYHFTICGWWSLYRFQ